MTAANQLVSIDIGSHKICTVIARILSDQRIAIDGIGISPSHGFQRGAITSKPQLSASIKQSLERAKSIAGTLPSLAICSLPQDQLNFEKHTGFIHKPQATPITDVEIQQCFQRSTQLPDVDANTTIIHAIPTHYCVDQTAVKDPRGVSGKSLEITSHLVLTPTPPITTVFGMLKQLKLDPQGILLDLVATGDLLITPEHQHTGAWVLDIGARQTRVGYFRHHTLREATIIPIGGDTVTQDIAHCLAIDTEQAERLKLLFGSVGTSPGKPIRVHQPGGNTIVESELLTAIITARIDELVELIRKTNWSESWANTPIYLCGGGSLLNNLGHYLGPVFGGIPQPLMPTHLRDWVKSSAYFTATGLIVAGLRTKCIAIEKPSGLRQLWQKSKAMLR